REGWGRKADVGWARRRAPCLTQLAHLCLRLLRPVAHAQFAVHRYRGGEVLLSVPTIALTAIQFAETKLAVGDERAHSALLGKRQGLSVTAFSVLRALRRGNIASKAEGMGLVSPST